MTFHKHGVWYNSTKRTENKTNNVTLQLYRYIHKNSYLSDCYVHVIVIYLTCSLLIDRAL